jgi:sortase A
VFTLKVRLTIACVITVVVGGLLAFRQAGPPIKQPSVVKAQKSVKLTQSYPGLPTRLKVLAIGLDAPVEPVGKTAHGDMAVPATADSIGWYKYGALPGETGTAVLAGHIVGPKGQPGVFTNISKLRPGDTFSVLDAKGLSTLFVITQTKTYGQLEQPAEVFNSSEGIHLNLITCAGDWDQSNHQYLERLVVFAKKSP